jgi:hypothetical protein
MAVEALHTVDSTHGTVHAWYILGQIIKAGPASYHRRKQASSRTKNQNDRVTITPDVLKQTSTDSGTGLLLPQCVKDTFSLLSSSSSRCRRVRIFTFLKPHLSVPHYKVLLA